MMIASAGLDCVLDCRLEAKVARVLVAMSGGVDSSVAAHLLLHAGHEVIGVFMRHGGPPESMCTTAAQQDTPVHKQGCCSAADAQDARRAADHLQIPFYALDLQADFGRIIDYFVDEYASGRTPNPCIVCNQWIKFGRLFAYAQSIGADYVATGHYARIELVGDGAHALCRGLDGLKDQSYVLFGVPRDRLAQMLLPVGRFTKPDIRRLAQEIQLNVADKPESQEICFVEPGRHGELVKLRRPGDDRSGAIVTMDGRAVGRHSGIENFTIGQRKGLGVAMGEPYFVVHIDAPSHQVVIGPRTELARRELTADNTNWLVDPPAGPFCCQAQIRYNSPPQPATAQVSADGSLAVEFDEPVYGVAPGQAVVCYQDARVLGGGWIR